MIYMGKLVPIKNSEHDDEFSGGSSGDSRGGTSGSVETINKVDVPKMYKVILLNDDFTPMDFVVLTLKRYFAMSEESAAKIMLDVHKKGAGVAGIFTLEIAEMRVMQCNQFARANQHPLKTTLEPE